MIIDSEGNEIGTPRAPFAVKAIWIGSFLALIVGVTAAMAFALWVALILIPLAIIVSGIASIVYRLQMARVRKQTAVSPRF